MAENPFDQFDAPEASATTSAAPRGGNPFDQFDAPVERQATLGTTAVAPFVGFNRGLANTIGAPVDLVNFGLRKAGLPVSDTPFGGSESIKRGLGLVGANPDDLKPASTTEKLLQGAGEGLAGAVVPEAALAGAARSGLAAAAPRTVEALQSAFGAGNSTAASATNAAIGAAGGLTGTGAEELAPEKFKPLANMAGNLVGGGAAALGAAGVQAGARAAGKAVEGMALTAKTQEKLAGKAIRESAQDPGAVSEAILDNPREIVPGSKPTTFQLTGDMGLGALERDVATASPEKFTQRRAEQNEARVGELTSLQPTGAPEDVSAFLRQRLGEIDAQTQGAVDSATQSAQRSAASLGGNESPELYGSRILDAVQPQTEALQTAARDAAGRIGGEGTPEGYGAAMRGATQEAREAAKAHERRLWNAIDPDGTLAMEAGPIQRAAIGIRDGLERTAKPLEGEENAIVQTAAHLDPVSSLNEVVALRKRINAAAQQELRGAGQTPTYARLTQLRGAVEDAISRAVEGRAAEHNEAVAAGTMAPEQTVGASLQREADAYVAAQREARRGATARAAGDGSAGSPGVSDAPRSQGQGRGQSAVPPRDQGVSGDVPLAPNLDESARERMRAANAATAARARTFDEGPVGATLRTLGQRGNYRVMDANVGSQFFAPGPGGAQRVQAFRNAVGDNVAATDALHNFAASSLRRTAMREDGTLDPNRFAAWSRQHADALRAVPELAGRFQTAADASRALADFRPFRPDLAPGSVPEVFFHSGPSGHDGVTQLRGLIGDERANAVLGDYAANRLRQAATQPDGTIDPGKLAAWRKSHADALRAFPELDARFSNAGRASEAIGAAAAERKQALDTFQAGAIGKILKVEEPADVTRTVGAIFGQKDSVAAMRRVAEEANRSPEAREGLRKAIADHIAETFIGNREAATTGTNAIKGDAFQTFVRKNRAALEQVFDEKEVGRMQAIADDIARANRSIDAVKLPGQSNTAQDVLKQLKKGPEDKGSLLKAVLTGAVGGKVTGGLSGAAVGAVGGAGKQLVGALRDAGMTKVSDLVRDAMLDPDLAATLLRKSSASPHVGPHVTLANQLKRLSVFSTVQGAQAGLVSR